MESFAAVEFILVVNIFCNMWKYLLPTVKVILAILVSIDNITEFYFFKGLNRAEQ